MVEDTTPQDFKSLVEKNFRLLAVLLSGLLLFGSGVFLAKAWNFLRPPRMSYVAGDSLSLEGSSSAKMIKVDVAGAVKTPGVFEIDDAARVSDVVARAGGFSDEADLDWVSKSLNLAAKVSDGQKIYVPKRDEVGATSDTAEVKAGSTVGGTPKSATSIAGGRININTASKAELDSLPEIGPSYAQRIIDYRFQNPFDNIEEIMEVAGIGEKTFEKIKDLVTVN